MDGTPKRDGQRMTKRDGQITVLMDHGFSAIDAAVNRLADYEDTGLAPEEVTALQASNQELKKDALPLLRAKIEERLVELPPIKIGDTAFFIINKHIFGGRVYFMRWEHHESFGIRGDISADCVVGTISASLFDVGKTVFSSRKKAEEVLKGQEG